MFLLSTVLWSNVVLYARAAFIKYVDLNKHRGHVWSYVLYYPVQG